MTQCRASSALAATDSVHVRNRECQAADEESSEAVAEGRQHAVPSCSLSASLSALPPASPTARRLRARPPPPAHRCQTSSTASPARMEPAPARPKAPNTHIQASTLIDVCQFQTRYLPMASETASPTMANYPARRNACHTRSIKNAIDSGIDCVISRGLPSASTSAAGS